MTLGFRIFVFLLSLMGVSVTVAAPATGPLRQSSANPRYFADPSGRIIHVTGLHTWANLQDQGATNPPPKFDFDHYLDQLERYHHNFIRLWSWEEARWAPWSDGKNGNPSDWYISPNPYSRTGRELALDGKPKFDLEKFDEAYFSRLRERVQKAGRRGIYVSIMLFQGWSSEKGWLGGKPWDGHPFNPKNNVQHFDGNPGGSGGPSLNLAAVRDMQSKYLRKVIGTVDDLDNVLFEVTNEGGNKDWDWWVVNTVHDFEKSKPKQHPVGLTAHGSESNDEILASPADWFSPGSSSWLDLKTDPREADGRKVSLVDTDHVWGVGGNPQWAWEVFMRGHNLLFMDPYNDPQWEPILAREGVHVDDLEGTRRAMGIAHQWSERLNLAKTIPARDISSTGFCLANPGVEYLIFQPNSNESFIAKIPEGDFRFEWFNPFTGKTEKSGEIHIRAGETTFKAPFAGSSALYLKKR
jgi:hypothetical protein